MAYLDDNKPKMQDLRVIDTFEVQKRIVKSATPVIPVSASNATTLDCSKGDVWTYTPTEATTITPINLAPGQRITIHFLTSGTTSYTVTFGAPFKVTGTLATGTTSGKYFAVSFTCNSAGTLLIEDSRTTAM